MMASAFQCVGGLSDHTPGWLVPVTAVALGAAIVEKHICKTKDEPGPDTAFSLEPHEFAQMVAAIRMAESALGSDTYERTRSETAGLRFRRSLFFTKDLPAGHRLEPQDLAVVRPGHGLSPAHLEVVSGLVLAKPATFGEPVSMTFFQP